MAEMHLSRMGDVSGSGMRSFTPDQLPAHRTFFTEFDRDPALVGVPTDVVDANMLRKLKLLVLTKSHVVIAASQLLESDTAHRLVLKYPALVTSGAVVSSMKARHPTTSQFLEEKRATEGAQKAGFLRPEAAEVAALIDSAGSAVRWELEAMSDWFRDRLVADLRDTAGLLNAIARRQRIELPGSIADDLEREEGLSRARVGTVVADRGNKGTSFLLRAYADFLYYLSGARTTDSMGVLPQDNFLDFTFSELLGRPSGMSEEEVFFKIFIDTVKAKTETIFPEAFLDSLSLAQALELREVGLQRGFIEGYNTIQTKTKDALELRDKEGLVLLLRELDELEEGMHASFSAALDRELSSREREARQRAAGRTLKTLTSMAYPRLFEPGAYKELFASTLEWMGRAEAVESVDERIARGHAALETLLEKSGILEKQPLLDFVSEMNRRYQSRML